MNTNPGRYRLLSIDPEVDVATSFWQAAIVTCVGSELPIIGQLHCVATTVDPGEIDMLGLHPESSKYR